MYIYVAINRKYEFHHRVLHFSVTICFHTIKQLTVIEFKNENNV